MERRAQRAAQEWLEKQRQLMGGRCGSRSVKWTHWSVRKGRSEGVINVAEVKVGPVYQMSL